MNDEQHVKKRRINYSQTIVYVCLASVVGFVVWLGNHDARQNDIERCLAGVDTRNVQRSIVEAVYDLATGAVQRDADSPPLTPDQIAQYNQYIGQVNAFRSDTYAMIKPSDFCKPYVDDDSVKPPTPPVPPLKLKER